jgi:dATP pyrophosphohydrolase
MHPPKRAGEDPRTAALREAHEEAGLPLTSPIHALTSQSSIPVKHFSGRDHWPADLYVIPEHTFGIDASGVTLTFSSEHTEFAWRLRDGTLVR